VLLYLSSDLLDDGPRVAQRLVQDWEDLVRRVCRA
jgi:hypothetical protein